MYLRHLLLPRAYRRYVSCHNRLGVITNLPYSIVEPVKRAYNIQVWSVKYTRSHVKMFDRFQTLFTCTSHKTFWNPVSATTRYYGVCTGQILNIYRTHASRKDRRRTRTVNYSLHYRVRIRSVIVRLRILFSTKFYTEYTKCIQYSWDCFPILLSQWRQSRAVTMPTKFQKISYNPRDVLGWQLSDCDKTPNVIRW